MKKGKAYNEISFGLNHATPCCATGTIHAERAAIERLPPRPSNKKPLKVSILVVRFTKSGKFGNSKCCMKCIYDMIKIPVQRGYRITKVYYSNRDGDIIKTDLKTLEKDDNKHVTRFFKTNNFRFSSSSSSSSSDTSSDND